MMSQHGQTCINSWHLRSPDAPDMPTLLQDFVDGVITPQRNDTASAVSFNELQYRRVDISGTSGAVFVPTGWPVLGADTGAELPSFAAVLIKGIASGQPRPSKIRKFLPGILETDSSGSGYAASGITKITAIVDAWQTYIDALPDLHPVAASYDTTPGVPGGIVDNVGGRWNEITDFSGTTNIARMSSRQVGRGI
jgi:hypothetical protein